MPKTLPNAVKFTGSDAGDVLVGIGGWELNRGMRMKVMRSLPRNGKGGRIPGPIKLLSAGDGKYRDQLKPHEEVLFDTTKELHDIICTDVGKPWIHIFNANCLEVENS